MSATQGHSPTRRMSIGEGPIDQPASAAAQQLEALEAEIDHKHKPESESERLRMHNAKLDDFVYLGRYALLVCLLSELMILCQLGNMLYMVYAGAAPSLASCGSKVFSPEENGKQRCAYLDSAIAAGGTKNGTCSEPVLKSQFYSVNAEFGYYCGETKLVKQSISIQMIGVMVGSVIFGNLSDRYGRRKIMAIALTLCLICMLITSFTNSLFWFTFWRFLVNVFNGGTMVILMVFIVENLPKKDRFWISNIITWSPNMVLYALIAYLSEDWRWLTRASVILALPALVLLMLLCESPRFLVQSRRLEDAKKAIQRIHRIDGRVCDEALLDHVLSKEEQLFLESKKKKKYNFMHLFYTWTFTRYTVAVAFSLMVTSIINYSLLFNMEKLSGSIYLNSVFMGLFRYSCNLAIAFLDIRFEKIGRKFVHFIAHFFASIALAFVAVVYATGYQIDLSDYTRVGVLSVIGVCSLLYTTNGIASNELFPTCIRNTPTHLARCSAVWSDLWTPLPYFTMLVLSLFDTLFFQFNVMETKGKPLSEHMPSKDQRLFRRKDKNMELLPKGSSANGEHSQKAEA
uniref:Major facilitator superfamily (MFS) profile domain-containing protein n=1 Tax=Ditylenchus dipsaci TaxID=166011 RepID=A0A915DKH5_9BILA